MSIKSNLVVFKAFGDDDGSTDDQTPDITQSPEFQAALEAKLAEEVEKATTENTIRLFRLPISETEKE